MVDWAAKLAALKQQTGQTESVPLTIAPVAESKQAPPATVNTGVVAPPKLTVAGPTSGDLPVKKISFGVKQPTVPAVTQRLETPAAPVQQPTTAVVGQVINTPPVPSTAVSLGIGSGDQPAKYTQDELDNLRKSFAILHNALQNPTMVGGAIRNVMLDLQANPHLVDILAPEDCGAMVEALRNSYGNVVQKKDTATSKRQATKAEVAEIMGDLAGLQIEL